MVVVVVGVKERSLAASDEGPDAIRALGRGLEVLALFSAERPELTLTQVAEMADLPLPTAQRVLRTLEQHRFVRRRFDRGPYALGPAILPLLPPLFASLTVPDVARPYIAELVERTGEAASLAVLERGEVLYLVNQAGRRMLTTNAAPGLRLPAHCSALGKALLSQLPDEEARALLGDEPYEQVTPNSRTSWAELAPDLAAARDLGYAPSHDEFEEGLSAYAVPIVTSWDAPAAINVSAPSSRWNDAYVHDTVLPALRAAADGISTVFRTLGSSGAS